MPKQPAHPVGPAVELFLWNLGDIEWNSPKTIQRAINNDNYTSIYMKIENEDVRKRMTMKIDASPLGTYICRLTGRSDFNKHSVCTYVPFRGEQITIVFVILAVRP